MLNKKHGASLVIAVAVAGTSYAVVAQQAPPQPMSFFVTSVGLGDGANLGGLAGADFKHGDASGGQQPDDIGRHGVVASEGVGGTEQG